MVLHERVGANFAGVVEVYYLLSIVLSSVLHIRVA
jgi:hypothetical protein